MSVIDDEILSFGSFGNGITVYFQGTETKVAHISADREVKYYIEPSENIKTKVDHYVKTSDPSVSHTQDIPVFNTLSEYKKFLNQNITSNG